MIRMGYDWYESYYQVQVDMNKAMSRELSIVKLFQLIVKLHPPIGKRKGHLSIAIINAYVEKYGRG